MDREVRVTCLRARTSDRTDGAGAGAQALAERLGGRVIGEPSPGRPRDWSEDLPEAQPVLEAAAAEISAALDQGELPLLTASDCSICIATMPTVARRVPGVRFLWIDAHGDFNTPETTPSGFLGGMCLGAACGRWDAGWPDTIDPRSVSFLGVRDLDPGEKVEVEAAGVGRACPRTARSTCTSTSTGSTRRSCRCSSRCRAGCRRPRCATYWPDWWARGGSSASRSPRSSTPSMLDVVLEILEPVTR